MEMFWSASMIGTVSGRCRTDRTCLRSDGCELTIGGDLLNSKAMKDERNLHQGMDPVDMSC